MCDEMGIKLSIMLSEAGVPALLLLLLMLLLILLLLLPVKNKY